MLKIVNTNKKRIKKMQDAANEPRPTQLGDMDEIAMWEKAHNLINKTSINLWEMYTNSRRNKIKGYVEHRPIQFEEFDINKIQSTPLSSEVNAILEASGMHLIIEDIITQVLEGSCLAIAIKIDDTRSYLKVLPKGKYQVKYKWGMPEKIYAHTNLEVPTEWDQKKPIQYMYIEKEKMAYIVQTRTDETGTIDYKLNTAELNELGLDKNSFPASFMEFKLNSESESLFEPIEKHIKALFNQYSHSWVRDLITSEAGVILNEKAFSGGALDKFKNDFLKTQGKPDTSRTFGTMIKMVIPATNKMGVASVDVWNPDPKSGTYQKEVKELFSQADEALRLHQILGNDGKSNNKTESQSSGFDIMFHTFCIDLCRKLTQYFKPWVRQIAKQHSLETEAMMAVSIVVQQQMKTAFQSADPFNPLGDGKAGEQQSGGAGDE